MLGHHASNPSLCLLHRGRSSHYHCSIVMNHAEESLNLYQHVPIVSNKWASPRDILVVIWGCAPPLKLVKVDLGICADGPLGTSGDRLEIRQVALGGQNRQKKAG